MTEIDALDVALRVAAALDEAGIAYFLGGSLATSIHGEPRATNDIDFVAELAIERTRPLIDALGGDFSIDPDMLRDAVNRRGTCNFFYLPLFTKVDVFVRRDEPFDRSEFARRTLVEVREGRALHVKTPEDSVIRKLLWYVAAGRSSDRQWRDVVSVLRIGGSSLDHAYLDDWAPRMGIADLLATARRHAEA